MIDLVCEVFQMVIQIIVELLGDDVVDEKIFIVFVRYEVCLGEYEWVWVIYRFGFDNFLRFKFMIFYVQYIIFEKQFGD